jgi:hypothetical protein
MSKSMHITYKVLKGLTNKEIDEQSVDPESDLAKLGHKSFVKSEVKKTRKNEKTEDDFKKKNGL